VPYFRYFRAKFAVPFYVHFLKQGRFDLVNIYFADCGESSAIRHTRRSCGYRLQFIAGYPFELVPHRYDAFDRLGLTALVDRVVAKSPAMVPGIRRRLNRPTVMIPNGVDADFFDPERFPRDRCRADLGLEPDGKVIVTVAALEERKGIQRVIQSLPLLVKRDPGIRYLVAGEGVFRPNLESLVVSLGLESNVQFMGSIDDVRPLLAAADAMALLSHGEGFPNALLEAWAMDRPVLVSNHPPYPDVVPSQLGRRVDETSPSDVADGLGQLFASDDGGRKGRYRQHAIQHHSWAGVASQIIEDQSG
jgi:glycosyltransferase involved in cell wall biosynthesis